MYFSEKYPLSMDGYRLKGITPRYFQTTKKWWLTSFLREERTHLPEPTWWVSIIGWIALDLSRFLWEGKTQTNNKLEDKINNVEEGIGTIS